MMSIDPVSSEQENQEVSATPEKKEVLSETMLSFKAVFEQQENVEERLKMSIAFMKESLAQEKTPRFKDFWEAKKMCLPLFKEKINPLVKAECWTQYTTLSSEAKRLKDLLEEQSAFAIEQIELALKGLEEELVQAPTLIQKFNSIGPSHSGTFLAKKWDFYDQKQKEILFYVHLAGRMKDLRTGIIETEMRIRHKNRLLRELSSLGDRFLPNKKEQMKLIAQEFVGDVELFVKQHFHLAQKQLVHTSTSFHLLRESIKEFQFLAKKLALNARAFSETREQLSQCWEVLKEAEKGKKQEFLERQEKSKQDCEQAITLISAFAQHFEKHPATTREAVQAHSQQVITDLEQRGLSHYDFKMLKAKLREAQEKALIPVVEQEKLHLAKKQQLEMQRKGDLELFKQQVHEALTRISKETLKSLKTLYDSFEERKNILKPDTQEEQKLEEMKKELYEALLLKKEEELTSEDGIALEELLHEWEAFREITRKAIERYRRDMGNSGFDFEKAMLLGKQVDLEKSRLDRALQKILDLEDKLA